MNLGNSDPPADRTLTRRQPNAQRPRNQLAGKPWATAAAALTGLGVTALVAAIVWLGADDRRRIAACDTGASAAPATQWEPLGLAVLAPLALLAALACVIIGYRRSVDPRRMIILGLVIALPLGLFVGMTALRDYPGYSCPYQG
jgi:hypothetical protein